MSFDKITRNLLAKTVAVCRRRLIEDVTDQLRGVFGLHPDGTVLPLDKLTHLSPDQAAAARRLRNLLDHYTVSAAGKESDRRKAAYERMVLEISFTILNRLAALRLCEERGLVIECVRKGTTSAGYQMFERISGGALGGRYDTYQVFLECLFDELALDLGMLFDRLTPQSTIFPTERCMEDVLVELNKPELTHLWTADETIGWVYQYFNPPEERKAMRDASSAPRNSHELAVRNQFFTPRYVVEFLTDNTLGRTWYEMRKGNTALKGECRYLVRRPNEIFLAPGENAPAVKESDIDLSQEELLKQPVYIEHRSPKDPRELRILDPACGSGHFLLYAFDLLERIYEEAWLDPELGPALWKTVGFTPQVDESLSDDVVDPESVRLRPDARPIGEGDCRDISDCYVVIADLYNTPFLAGRPLVYSSAMCEEKKDRILLKIPAAEFSYRKAVEMGWFTNVTGTIFLDLYKELFTYSMGGPREGMFEKFDQAARDENLSRLHRAVPKLIIEHNLHGIDIDPRAVQIAAMALWLRAQKTWQRMGLKPGERPTIKRTNIVTAEPMPGEGDLRAEFVASLKPRVLGQIVDVVFDRMQLAGEVGSLLKIEEEIREAIAEAKRVWLEPSKEGQHDLFPGTLAPKVEQLSIFDVRDVTDAQFWEQAEDRILAALQVYAERAQNGHALRRRLFAEDAARGFAFIDLCRQRYDVALMNPPFGDASIPSKPYIEDTYGDTKGDVYKAFVECFQTRLVPAGFLGIISSRTGFFLGQSEDWRTRIVLRLFRPIALADLGMGVLDAMVEVAAYVLRSLSDLEARDLTRSLVPILEKVACDRKDRFSLPKWQAARGDLKRHQAIAELEHLEAHGYIQRSDSNIVRYTPLWDLVKKVTASPEPAFPPLVCVRALTEQDKAGTLIAAIDGSATNNCFICNPSSFSAVPGSRFAYWVGDALRGLFQKFMPLESEGRDVQSGASTMDDFRFLRLNWEVPGDSQARSREGTINGKRWVPLAKGGAFSRYYFDWELVLDWANDGDALKTYVSNYRGAKGWGYHWAAAINGHDQYFRPGLTWPRRTQGGLSIRVMPGGGIFGDKGPAIFAPGNSPLQLMQLLAITNSLPFRFLVSLQMAFGSYEVGVLERTPIPPLENDISVGFAQLGRKAWAAKRAVDTVHSTSHAFFLPTLLAAPGSTLAERAAAWAASARTNEETVTAIQAEIDDLAFNLYGLGAAERTALITTFTPEATGDAEAEACEDKEGDATNAEVTALAADLLGYALGSAFGLWDISHATGERPAPEPPDPFVALPVCPPGMLQNADGFPAAPKDVPADYSLRISWDGILVDDPGYNGGQTHRDDIVRRVREVFDLLWKEKSHEIEQEACDILGISDLRNYFRKPAGFFQDHLKRYSKSRRKAPIYWPLSTVSGSYTLWFYYHRLTDQTLYLAVNNYVEPKIADIERGIARIENDLNASSGGDATRLTDQLNETLTFLGELRDLREELLHIAALPYKPNLNDGVIINAAPFFKLFRLRSWANDTEDCWKKLKQGDYDWAHLAYTIWPDRVREVCKTDRSIAIANGLEALCEVKVAEKTRKKRSGKGITD